MQTKTLIDLDMVGIGEEQPLLLFSYHFYCINVIIPLPLKKLTNYQPASMTGFKQNSHGSKF